MSTSNAECIYSTLAADPDLGELTTMFAEETPDRIATLLDQLDRQDWAALRRTAHQIKGAAGGYGFDALTMPAAVLEHNCPGDPETIAQLAGELVGLMRRVRAGVPE